MADNVRATPSTGSTGALFATDEMVDPLGSTDVVHVPLSKIVYGAANSGTPVSTNAGLPVYLLGSTTLSVSGSTVSVSGSTISVSGSSVTLSGVSSDAGLPVRIMGSTVLTANVTNTVTVNVTNTLSVSGSTVSVSGSTVSVSGSSVTLNGVSSDAGLPVRIMGSTVLTANVTNTVTVNVTNTLSVSGSTVSVSGSTISVSGSSVTLNGVSTNAGLPVFVLGSTTLVVSGSTVSVSGSTVSVSGSTVSVVNGSTFLVQPQAYASGGADAFSFITTTAANSTGRPIKAAAGQVYNLAMFNTSSTPVYGRLYNQTTTPASTDDANIKWRFVIPGSTAGAGFVESFPLGLAFGTGVGIRLSAGVADTDTTVLSSSPTYGNVGYK